MAPAKPMRSEAETTVMSGSRSSRPIAEELAKKQKEISVSEFFERNKHILGFDSSNRALITSVKEAVDNALDACEEAGILPDIAVEIRKVAGEGGLKEAEYALVVEDNGPGIVKKQIGNIFARLLYGSRFHAIRQSRGQQGIGISAVVMYGQLTTGKPAIIESKIGEKQPLYRVELKLDTKRNLPDVIKEEPVFGAWPEKPHGTRVTVHMIGKYQRGPQSVFEYLRGTAIVNPHARITLKEPDGGVTVFERATDQLPPPTQEIKPHPQGIELGQLLKMAKNTSSRTLSGFLQEEFSRVSADKAKEICKAAGLGEDEKPADLEAEEARKLIDAFGKVKLMAPPTDCLSPIGEVLVKKGLKKEMGDVEFIATVTRPASVYAGRPFQVEVGIAYGGSLPRDEPVRVIRFANRVPLMYQKGACVSTIAVESTDWRRYELEQRGGKGIPVGPAVILVHLASVNVPFTSEAKEAIAEIDEIHNEVKLALQDCGRKLGSHIRKRAKLARMKEKEAVIRKIIPKIAEKSASILGRPVPDYEPVIARIMNNVMIDDAISANGGGVDVSIRVTNYTSAGKSFDLYSVVPHGVEVAKVSPEPDTREDGLLGWRVKKLGSTENLQIAYALKGVSPADYDETDLYVKGVDPEIVIGAEEWKGKGDAPEEAVERVTVVQKGDGTYDAPKPEPVVEVAPPAGKGAKSGKGENGDGGELTILKADTRPLKGGKAAKASVKVGPDTKVEKSAAPAKADKPKKGAK
jgi:DNA topoisomerase-6 subunit B